MTSIAINRTIIRNRYLDRIVVPILVLALCAWVGQATPTFHIGSYNLFTIVVAGLGASLFFFISVKNFQSGLFIVVLSAFFVNVGIGTGTQTRIPASMILTGFLVGVWLLAMLVRKRLRLVSSDVNAPLLGFILISIISVPWSGLFWRPELFLVTAGAGTPFQIVQLAGLALMILLPSLFFLGLNSLKERRWIKAICGVIFLVGAIALVGNLTHRQLSFGVLNVNTGGLFPLWIVALVYAQILFNDQLKTWQRGALGVLFLGWIYYQFGLGTTWFSGWVPAMLAVLFLTYLKSKRAAFGVLFLLAIPVLVNPLYFYDKIWVKAQVFDFNRFTIWPTVISLTLTHASAVFGAGPVGYMPLYRTFILGQAWSAHNNYVDIFAETGILGSIFFAWFLFSTFRTGWKSNTKIKDGFLRGFNNGVLAALVGTIFAMMLGDWFLPFVYNIGFVGFNFNAYSWMLLGAMVGLGRITAPESAPTVIPVPQGPRATVPV